MITLKLINIEVSDEKVILLSQNDYTYAFHFLYKTLEESSDTELIDYIKERFHMNDIQYRSLKQDCTTTFNQNETRRKNLLNRIEEINDDLSNDESLKDNKRYKLWKKLQYLQKAIDFNSVYGGRKLLQKISREYNKPVKERSKKLKKWKEEYRKNRTRSFFTIGEANQTGNRFYDFSHLTEGLIVYKPSSTVHIDIHFKVTKKNKELLEQLQNLAETKSISISVSQSLESTNLSFDELVVHQYNVDEKSRRKDVRAIKEQNLDEEKEKELIKSCYKYYYREQELRMFKDKIVNRYMAVDLNPTNIGYSVLETVEDGYKVIEAGVFDMSELAKKLGVSSSHPKQKRLNNKRKYELTIVLKKLFSIAKHYRCAFFCMEDLDFKHKDSDTVAKEANRKNKNIWNVNLIKQIITRRCNELGMKKIEVSPCYTSFIGNIQHPYEDAASASIEIGRRGSQKYISNGDFYPDMSIEDIHTLEAIFFEDCRDVEYSTVSSWVEIYKSCKLCCKNKTEFENRFRAGNVSAKTHSYRVSSQRSKLKHRLFEL